MPSEGLNLASSPEQPRYTMHRRAGLAFGVALAFVAGLSLAACGQGETSESSANSAPQAVEAQQTAQTTAATMPVVTVYKSPT
jgi:hypothetical protein